MDETPTNPLVLEEPVKDPTVLELRRDAAQATVDKYRGVEFKPGAADCVKMAMGHLRQLKVAPRLGQPLNYRTLLQGKALLNRLGYKSLPDVLDAHFPEIAPASALVGDIMEMEAMDEGQPDGLGSLVIYLGNGAVFGWHEAATGGTVMRIGDAPLRAWRVI